MEGFVDFAARDKLLRTVLGRVVRSRLRRICNLTGTDSRTPSVFVSCDFFSRCSIVIRTFQILTDVGCIDIGFHAFQFLQLCDVDGIGVICTGGQAVNLASYCAICFADGYSCIGGLPSSSSICRILTSGRIISFRFLTCYRGFGPAADGNAALSADFGIVADGYDVGGCRFIVGGIGRTDDDVVLLVRQFVVITEDDIGLVRIDAITADLVIRADDIVVLAVGQLILEAVDEVVLRRCSFCVGTVITGYFVTYTGDLGHVGFVNGVAAAHDHDLGTAGRYCRLQVLSHSCCILILDILLHLAQIEFRGINSTVRIGNRVACTIDDGSIRIRRRIGLADNAVSYATDRFCGICILVDVERAIRQSRCTLQTSSDNARIGTGYRRYNAVCMGVKACSDTAHTLSAIVLFVAVILAIEVCKLWQCCFINSIVFDIMVLIVQLSRIGCNLGIQSTQILACRLVCRNNR